MVYLGKGRHSDLNYCCCFSLLLLLLLTLGFESIYYWSHLSMEFPSKSTDDPKTNEFMWNVASFSCVSSITKCFLFLSNFYPIKHQTDTSFLAVICFPGSSGSEFIHCVWVFLSPWHWAQFWSCIMQVEEAKKVGPFWFFLTHSADLLGFHSLGFSCLHFTRGLKVWLPCEIKLSFSFSSHL